PFQEDVQEVRILEVDRAHERDAAGLLARPLRDVDRARDHLVAPGRIDPRYSREHQRRIPARRSPVRLAHTSRPTGATAYFNSAISRTPVLPSWSRTASMWRDPMAALSASCDSQVWNRWRTPGSSRSEESVTCVQPTCLRSSRTTAIAVEISSSRAVGSIRMDPAMITTAC